MATLEEVTRELEAAKNMRNYFPIVKPSEQDTQPEGGKLSKSQKKKANKAQVNGQTATTVEEDLSIAELRRRLEDKRKELRSQSHAVKKPDSEREGGKKRRGKDKKKDGKGQKEKKSEASDNKKPSIEGQESGEIKKEGKGGDQKQNKHKNKQKKGGDKNKSTGGESQNKGKPGQAAQQKKKAKNQKVKDQKQKKDKPQTTETTVQA